MRRGKRRENFAQNPEFTEPLDRVEGWHRQGKYPADDVESGGYRR